jgi:hypothetical protein
MLRSNRELQAKDNVLRLTDRRHNNKRDRRPAVSSYTDEKQLASRKKRRRVVKAVKKEEESQVTKEEEIEGDLQQDEDEPEDCMKPPAVAKKEEDDETEVKEDGEDDFPQDNDERVDTKKPPAAVKEEIKVAMNDPDVDVAEFAPAPIVSPESDSGFFASICYTLRTLFSRPALNYRSQQGHLNPAPTGIDAQKDEVELKEDGEGDLQLDIDETTTKPLLPLELPSDTDTRVKTSSSTRKEDTSINTRPYPKRSRSSVNIVKKNNSLRSLSRPDNCRSAERNRSSANIVKRKYSLQSPSPQNNKESARSKPLRKDKGSSTNSGEVKRSPMASSDEDEFGRGIESAVDEASDTSDSLDGIVDQGKAIFDRYDAKWNIMYERLRAFKESHGHCELFWAVDCSPSS